MNRLTVFLFFISSLSGLAQAKKTTITAYKKMTLQEKNIIRLDQNPQGDNAYAFLMDPILLKSEIEDFFAPHLDNLDQEVLTVALYENNYYFISKNPVNTIISLAHLVYIPRVDKEYLIYGSNHCVLPSSQPYCYPATDGSSCMNPQPHCQKLLSKLE